MSDELGYSSSYDVVERALGGEELEPDEAEEILGFINREVSELNTPNRDSYVVLGSYKDGYIRRTSAVENELNKRTESYAFLMGDLPDLNIRDILPQFRIKFHLICKNVDYVVGVYEDELGGEIEEFGKVSDMYLKKSYILAREYEDENPYSPPTESDMKTLELNDRLYWWSDEQELRRKVDEIP